MAFSIVNNVGSIVAHDQLVQTEKSLNRTIERLSTGLRINDAGDDASGLAIADTLRADVNLLNQAVRNANDGISLLQTADATLNEISGQLQRALTLAEQAASDTSGADGSAEKLALGDEYEQVLQEINRISLTVDFNGKTLFGASGSTTVLQVGTGATASEDTLSVSLSSVTASGIGLSVSGSSGTTTVTTTALDTGASARAEIETIKSAIDSISSSRGTIGAKLNRLDSTVTVLSTQAQNLTAAESQIRDADIAQEVTDLTKLQVLQQTGLSALSQANFAPQNVLALLG